MDKENELQICYRRKLYWDSDEENKNVEIGSRNICIQEDGQDTTNTVQFFVRDIDKLCKALQKVKKELSWRMKKIPCKPEVEK